MQCAVSLGRINIVYATIVLYRYIPAPRKVHLDNIQHLFGFLNKYRSMSIKFNTKIPTYENFKMIEIN